MRLLKRIFLILIIVTVVLLIAVQVASNFFLKSILEREATRIFQVPVSIEQAGANLFSGSFWMKGVRIRNLQGLQQSDFITARTIAIDFNLLSFLTSEFAINRILFKDPQFTFETNEKGELNVSLFADQVAARFRKFYSKGPKLIHLITKYTVEKFAVRNGMIEFIDQRQNENSWTLKAISFSLARLVYPPDPGEALPVAIYVNATAPTAPEGKILILGRLNPFVKKKSFDITGSAKNLIFNQSSDFMPDFPLRFLGGTLQVKLKALCHDNQVDLYHQVRINKLKFVAKESIQKKSTLAFGLPAETVVHFFNDLQPSTEPFEFDFHVMGDLGDPKFNVLSQTQQKIREAVYQRVSSRMKLLSS